MRPNLVIQFYCGACGSQLDVPTDGERKFTKQGTHGGGGINGGDMAPYAIAIAPCRKCVAEVREPVEVLARAIKGIIEKGEPDDA